MPDAAAFPPPLSCDCHTHVIGPKSRYPLASPRAYTPADAPVEVLEAMLQRSSIDRVVLVQTSIFGTDNRCMLDGMARLGDRCRGVAVPSETAQSSELDAMHRAGVRGIRVNLATLGVSDPAEARRLLRNTAGQCERNGWHLQLFASSDTISVLEEDLAAFPVPLVIDHFGLLSPVTPDTPAERAILRLLESGKGWVKLSGSYRLEPPDPGPAMAELALRLSRANPENIVWGSDWPHTPAHSGAAASEGVELPYRELDDVELLATVRRWFGEPRQWRQILVDNPARLYDF